MIPVVVLTGFLGSGKTTLLNKLLSASGNVLGSDANPGKLAVIVNEFGDVGIDGDLLPPEMSRQVELPGGCVCCVLDDDLGKTIIELLTEDDKITLIIIETTGIAEPLPIAWTLAGDSLREIVRLAAVVTTVDVTSHERHRPLSPSVDAQVIDADILAITKVDLVESEDVEALTKTLRAQNAHAPILRGDLIDALRGILGDPDARSVVPIDSEPIAAGHAHHHIESVAAPITTVLDYEELTETLNELPENYLRIKGIANVVDPGSGWDEPVHAAFHRVGARVSVERLSGPRRGEPRIVAVGYELDVDALKQCLADAALDS